MIICCRHAFAAIKMRLLSCHASHDGFTCRLRRFTRALSPPRHATYADACHFIFHATDVDGAAPVADAIIIAYLRRFRAFSRFVYAIIIAMLFTLVYCFDIAVNFATALFLHMPFNARLEPCYFRDIFMRFTLLRYFMLPLSLFHISLALLPRDAWRVTLLLHVISDIDFHAIPIAFSLIMRHIRYAITLFIIRP